MDVCADSCWPGNAADDESNICDPDLTLFDPCNIEGLSPHHLHLYLYHHQLRMNNEGPSLVLPYLVRAPIPL